MEGEISEGGAELDDESSEIEAFDSFFMCGEPVPQDEDEVDEVTFTNYLSSHFVGRPHAPTEEAAMEDFRIGGGRL